MKKIKNIFNTIGSILTAILIAIIIRSVVAEPFSIPSGSMKPNFLVGDYLFVSKYYYGISRYSFPFGINLFSGRKFVLHQPKRGDVIVFRLPKNPNVYYIKRLVGLPGDTIQVKDSRLYLNGEKLNTKIANPFIDSDGHNINAYHEFIDDNTSYLVLDETTYGISDNTKIYKVPDKHYFFMGDNRDNSIDSRFARGPVGFIPEEYLIGKAEIILFSNKEPLWKIWKWLFNFDINRFFIKVIP